MGKLHDLAKLRDGVSNIAERLTLENNIKQKRVLVKVLKDNNIEYGNITALLDNYQLMLEQNQTIVEGIKLLIPKLEADIDSFINEQPQKTYDRVEVTLPSEVNDVIESKIKSYCHWQYAGLQINCQFKKWIDAMVSCDPLYLLYENEQQLKAEIEEYGRIYQNRLRLYNICDLTRDAEYNHRFIQHSKFTHPEAHQPYIDSTANLELTSVAKLVLPQQQFGFVLCWDTFIFLGLDKIKEYLVEVFDLLRPGGTFVFNYNNCDMIGSALQAEKNEMGYCSFRILKKVCEDIGYITKFENLPTGDAYNTHVSWAEISKPGTLISPKRHQVVGEVIDT